MKEATTKTNSTHELGDYIRRMRKSQGLTQQDVADYSGLGRRFVIELENGKATVRMDKVLKVLQGLGIDLAVAPRGVLK